MKGARPRSVTCPICSREFMKHSLPFHLKSCRELYKKWDGFESMPSARNSELLYGDVLDKHHDKCFFSGDREITPTSIAGWDAAATVLPTAAPAHDEWRFPCSTCGRLFCSDSLPRHEVVCLRLNMSRKKRGAFDSARARAKGTDLEFFFPSYDWAKRERGAEPQKSSQNWRQQSVEFRMMIRRFVRRDRPVSSSHRSAASRPRTAGTTVATHVSGSSKTRIDIELDQRRQNQVHVLTGTHSPIFQGRMRPTSSPSGLRSTRRTNQRGVTLIESINGLGSSGRAYKLATPTEVSGMERKAAAHSESSWCTSPQKEIKIPPQVKQNQDKLSLNMERCVARPKTSGGRIRASSSSCSSTPASNGTEKSLRNTWMKKPDRITAPTGASPLFSPIRKGVKAPTPLLKGTAKLFPVRRMKF